MPAEPMLSQPEYFVMRRRQALPPEAHVSVAEAVEILQAGRAAALSYREAARRRKGLLVLGEELQQLELLERGEVRALFDRTQCARRLTGKK
jgi:hypothetical protein